MGWGLRRVIPVLVCATGPKGCGATFAQELQVVEHSLHLKSETPFASQGIGPI